MKRFHEILTDLPRVLRVQPIGFLSMLSPQNPDTPPQHPDSPKLTDSRFPDHRINPKFTTVKVKES